MYEQFYGLREKPFSPDTDFFYRDRIHQEALNVLMIALHNGEGFVQIIGDVGTGKTLLCRQLLKMLEDEYTTAYIPNPLLSQFELYKAIADELSLDIPEKASAQHYHQRIFTELIELKEKKRPLVILIDEAQVMPRKSLEALRLLSNLETKKEKLLHILFFAQPELEKRLAQENLRQLRQRITFSYALEALPESEVATYLDHRLRIAGYQGSTLFAPKAVKLLYDASKGVPRLINLLAHKALLSGYGKGARRIESKMVKAAISDTSGLQVGMAGETKTRIAGIALLALLFAFAWFAWGVVP